MTALTQLKLAGTGSFRLASSKLFDVGVNSQNLPKEVLDIVCAPPGWSIVQVDQAGAEALVVAYLTRPGRYRNLFLNGVKAHTYVALQLFLDKFRGEHPRERYWLVDPAVLKQYPEFKKLSDIIKFSKFEYDIGKRTGHACCDAATEVLTPRGWVPIWTKPPVIMCSNQEAMGGFDSVTWNEYDYNGPLYYVVGAECMQVVTPNHGILYQTNGNNKVLPAAEFAKLKDGTRQVVNTLTTTSREHIDPYIFRLAAAIQADGSYTGNRVRFHFAKARKIRRLTELLQHFGIAPDWCEQASGAWKCSLLRTGPVAQACALLTYDKQFSWELLQYSATDLQALVDEVQYWDGYIDSEVRNYRSFFSIHKHNVDVLYTAARLIGIGSTIRSTPGLHNTLWTVSFNRRQRCQIDACTTMQYTGKVYCPTTPAGFFLIRREGKIAVTKNSNYRMGPNTFREQCLKESEGTLILDVEQARYFLDTYKQLFPEIVEWQNEIEAQIRSTRTLRNLFGFPRRFERHITDGYIREAISWIPQSTVGCITHRAYREVYDIGAAQGRVWRLFNNKHDSFAMLVPDRDIRDAAHCMSRALNQELVGRDGEVFRMKSEVQVGKNWGKFDPKHPELNPLGMQDYVLTE